MVGNDGNCVRLVAESFIGVSEKGGNNQGFTDIKLQSLMAREGWLPSYAWCSFFVRTILQECGIPNTITGWSPSAYNKNDVIFTDGEFKKPYYENDVLVMTLSYAKFNGKRFKGIGHTGIVNKVKQNSVETIEGNTNDAGARDSRSGDGVYKKLRPLSKSIHITRWGGAKQCM